MEGKAMFLALTTELNKCRDPTKDEGKKQNAVYEYMKLQYDAGIKANPGSACICSTRGHMVLSVPGYGELPLHSAISGGGGSRTIDHSEDADEEGDDEGDWGGGLCCDGAAIDSDDEVPKQQPGSGAAAEAASSAMGSKSAAGVVAAGSTPGSLDEDWRDQSEHLGKRLKSHGDLASLPKRWADGSFLNSTRLQLEQTPASMDSSDFNSLYYEAFKKHGNRKSREDAADLLAFVETCLEHMSPSAVNVQRRRGT